MEDTKYDISCLDSQTAVYKHLYSAIEILEHGHLGFIVLDSLRWQPFAFAKKARA